MSYIGPIPAPVPIEKQISGVNVGTIIEVPVGKIPSSYLKCDASKFSKTTFPELFNYLGTDVTPLRTHEYRIGDVKWFPKRANIDPDFVPADGQLLNHADYPDVQSMLAADKVHQADDHTFSNDPSVRCHWMTSLPDVFRVPDFNGKTQNTLGSVFLRGDGKNAESPGYIQLDAIRNITGFVAGGSQGTYAQIFLERSDTGVFEVKDTPFFPGDNGETIGSGSSASVGRKNAFFFNASRVVPTAEENRPLNVAGCWAVRVKYSTEFVIKAAGFVENEGLVKISGLVEKDSDLQRQIDALMPQSGGTNTDSYVKFPDGTMIQTFQMIVPKTASNTGIRASVAYPYGPFVRWPAIVWSCYGMGPGSGGAIDAIGQVYHAGIKWDESDASTATLNGHTYTGAIVENVVIQVVATGRWK